MVNLMMSVISNNEGNKDFNLEITNTFNILIADGNIKKRTMLSQELSRKGYLVTECSNGWELMKILGTSTPSGKSDFDLIISSVLIDGPSGLDIQRFFRNRKGFPPVILISSSIIKNIRKEAKRLGITAIFDENLDVNKLLIKVNELIPIPER